MTNIDKVAVLSSALSALSARETTAQAQAVAGMLVDACKKLAEQVTDESK